MSDINGRLHFSPKYTFENIETALENGDKDYLIKAFKDRICGFYLKPAEELNRLNIIYPNGCVNTMKIGRPIRCVKAISVKKRSLSASTLRKFRAIESVKIGRASSISDEISATYSAS